MREWLAGVPEVRAALLLARSEVHCCLRLVTTGAENAGVCARVATLLRAVTPPEEQWTVSRAFTPEETLRGIVAVQPPLYATAEFTAAMRPG